MTAEQILKDLEEIFRDNFDDDELELTRETTADDIEDWDSLEQINLLTTIEPIRRVFASMERTFGIRFLFPENAQYGTVIGAALCQK